MIDLTKMELANHWLARAINYEAVLGGDTRLRMINFALNKACALELEALGYHVFNHKEDGLELGAAYGPLH
ncbi:MAG: hypothetical protein MN733_21560 [Nitrososphaera sp.]|nr:hypothetical protein [Nitrososphaera sp.]